MAKKNKDDDLIKETVETSNEAPAEMPQSSGEKTVEDVLAEQNERYLRLAAEYDNFRKRSVRERESLYADVKAMVLTELLPVIDNFERANANDAGTEDFKKGIDMTFNQLMEILCNLKVESFGEKGDPFDPILHNAVMHEEDGTLPENSIAEVFAKGYRIGDKLLRPAMVKVAN